MTKKIAYAYAVFYDRHICEAFVTVGPGNGIMASFHSSYYELVQTVNSPILT